MQVAIVSVVSSIEDWSRRHPEADIKRIEPVSYETCGCTLTYFAIYYEVQQEVKQTLELKIPTEYFNTGKLSKGGE